MIFIIKLFLFISNFFNIYNSFELVLWKGSTHFYLRNKNNYIDFNKPLITYYNYTNNISKNTFHNIYYYNINNFVVKLKSLEDSGCVIIKASKDINNTYFNSQVNFFHNTLHLIITVNYNYNYELKHQVNYISISSLDNNLNKYANFRKEKLDINSLLKKINNWTYCKSTLINTKTPFIEHINNYNSFDYKYLLTNKNNINKVFIENLVISVPNIIDDNKPFTILLGCLISNDCYKQIILNYNFNGCLVSVEFNEYKPYNLIELFKLQLRTLKNKTISFHNKAKLSRHYLL